MRTILLLGVAFFALTSCGNKATTKEATDYNDQLVVLQKDLLSAEAAFFEILVDGSIDACKDAKKEWESKAKNVQEKTEKMDPLDDQDELRKGLIKLSETHLKLISGKINQLITLIAQMESPEVSDEQYNEMYDKMEAMYNEINETSKKANDQFLETQKEFAKRYNIQLTK